MWSFRPELICDGNTLSGISRSRRPTLRPTGKYQPSRTCNKSYLQELDRCHTLINFCIAERQYANCDGAARYYTRRAQPVGYFGKTDSYVLNTYRDIDTTSLPDTGGVVEPWASRVLERLRRVSSARGSGNVSFISAERARSVRWPPVDPPARRLTQSPPLPPAAPLPPLRRYGGTENPSWGRARLPPARDVPRRHFKGAR